MDVNGGRVLIELAEAFAPQHVKNIQQLARQHYWDGLAIVRAQENYVVQWGDPEEDEAKRRSLGEAKTKLPAEFDRERQALPWQAIPDPDAYAAETGFSLGFPVGRDSQRAWLLHCYGMVGAGRGNEADSSKGSELYVVSGHSPRHLDRNITLVGRVIEGMSVLTTLSRGTGPLGFYEKPEQRVSIERIRLASEIDTADRPRRQRLSTESASFAKLIEARRFRHEDWFVNKVGRIEVCNVPLPVRRSPESGD
ncbi:peptidylprolyl isomerase [Pseudoxanthomonas sp. CAU 1598]|uniref:peptidylprolyl isomerase n=2 Tax=Pseudomarimonas arenosa TaxID=2774145 RepID=A0AAW3ZKH0_9GAMM|nr:peptidylprolyl isomerase [Pseudomarimonas arenosa]